MNDAYSIGITLSLDDEISPRIAAIDDLPLPAPANEGQIEMIVQKLGDEGLAAVAAAFQAAQADKRANQDSAKN